jgi:hypothetical protein
MAALNAACKHPVAQIPALSNHLAWRWDLTIKTPAGELPSRVEVSFSSGAPKVLFVGVLDYAVPPEDLEIRATEFSRLDLADVRCHPYRTLANRFAKRNLRDRQSPDLGNTGGALDS